MELGAQHESSDKKAKHQGHGHAHELRHPFDQLPIAGGPDPLLFVGGPVARDEVLGLVRAPFGDARARVVLRDVAIVGTAGLESAMSEGASADRLRLYSGYSGWGPGQLEREIARGDWRIMAGDADVVFSSDPDRLWREQLRLLMDRVVV
jgi:putative transcriptional regulator